jgi:myo-inositol-1(or 4)-monophosphatase
MARSVIFERIDLLSFDSRALDTRLHVACAIAREAGEIAKRRFVDRGSFTVGFKGPQDYLTEVDSEVERLIATRLHRLFPEDGFIGEEGEGRTGDEGAPVWVVDPIDGTANFARGAPHFCVSIAAVAGREIEIGVIYDPMLDELFAARHGAGATLNGIEMRVSETKDLKVATIEAGWNMRYGADRYIGLISRIVATGAGVVRSGSGALGLAYVAAGRRDGYVENHMNAWDCLAAIALVREAGGYVSDFLSNEGLRKGGPILASAPGVKDALLAAAAIEGLQR